MVEDLGGVAPLRAFGASCGALVGRSGHHRRRLGSKFIFFFFFNLKSCIEVLGWESAYLPVHAGGGGEDERRVDDCAIAEPPNFAVRPISCDASHVRSVHCHIFASRNTGCEE